MLSIASRNMAIARVIAGFFAAPVLPGFAHAVIGFSGLNFGRALILGVLFVGYPFAIAFGVPGFFLMRYFGWLRLGRISLVAAPVFFLIGSLVMFGAYRRVGSRFAGGAWLGLDGHITLQGYAQAAMAGLGMALLGLTGVLAFWAVALWRNPMITAGAVATAPAAHFSRARKASLLAAVTLLCMVLLPFVFWGAISTGRALYAGAPLPPLGPMSPGSTPRP